MNALEGFRGRRVLVTGGAGVIGRETLRMLVRVGAEILSVDRERLPDRLKSVQHLQIDLARDDLAALSAFRPEVVIHLAATFERSEESPDFWEPNWYDNVLLSHRLAEVLRGQRVQVLVFASSYLVYDPTIYLTPGPTIGSVMLDEAARQAPRNLCGAAKLYSEAEFAFASSHLDGPARVIQARIFRVYGRGSRDIISRWVRAALAGEPLTVFQRENRFDYIYAGDVAEALLRLAMTPGAGGIVNVATGVSRSIDDVLATLAASLPDVTLLAREQPSTAHYESSVADVSRIRELTGWIPAFDLGAGITELVDWERHLRG